MACQLTITPHVRRVLIGGNFFIVVSGTATECTKIIVRINCGAGDQEGNTATDSAGNWTIDFPNHCSCSKPITVTATCSNEPNCTNSFSGILECDPDSGCPSIQVVTQIGDCISGKRLVSFNVVVNGVGTIVTQVDFGDGNFSMASATLNYTVTHLYDAPSTATPSVLIILPSGCPPVSFVLPTLQGCFDCPTSNDVTLIPGDCDSGGKRQYTLTVHTSGSGIQLLANIDFGDGSPVASIPFTAGNTFAVTHSYSTGQTYNVIIQISNCASLQKTTGIVADCPKGGGGGGTTDPGEGGGCLGLRWAFVILSILAAITFLISLCVPGSGSFFLYLSLGFAAAAAVVMIIWFILRCPKPCGWGYLMAWQIALGTGLGAMYFKDCCPWMFWVGLGLIISGLSLLLIWIRRCNKTACEVAVELSVIITSIAVPAISWLANLNCGNSNVATIIVTISGLIALWVGYCYHQSHNNESALIRKKDCGCK